MLYIITTIEWVVSVAISRKKKVAVDAISNVVIGLFP